MTDGAHSVRIKSKDLKPGTVMVREDGAQVTLLRRKRPEVRSGMYHPGWWCVEGGGLADFVIDAEDSPWSPRV